MMARESTVDKDKATGDQGHPLEMGTWYRFVRGVVGLLLRLLARLEIEGLEHVPSRGPYLLLVNHLHWLDPPALAVAYPHRSYLFAAEKWERHWLLGPFLGSMDAIFVNRGEVDRRALRQAMAVLRAGGVLGMAPEGTRSKTGGLQRGRSGAAYLAFRTGARFVPTVITGQERVFPSLRRFRRTTVHVVFGPPFEPPPVDGRASSSQIHEFTEEIMYRMAAMLPAEYRGVYGDVEDERPDLMDLYATKS
jgi:1-acyl-sn-glycerol-3-phosphate acyltransferase